MTRVLKLEPQVTCRKQGSCIWTHVGPSLVSDLFFTSLMATIIQYHPMMPIFKFLFLMQFSDWNISPNQSPGSCFGSCLPSPLGQDDLKLRWRETLAPGDALVERTSRMWVLRMASLLFGNASGRFKMLKLQGFPFLPTAMDNDGK